MRILQTMRGDPQLCRIGRTVYLRIGAFAVERYGGLSVPTCGIDIANFVAECGEGPLDAGIAEKGR